ncbi:MAG TPA: type II toxin-antitoxin system RelE/ParE family toxin [Methylomirabilota bacterium]|nr:type II toxin-antitoxin system RelE/ParE family toxin [Methylomirabilota bacterium]
MTGRLYAIRWTETALRMLEEIRDRRVRTAVFGRVGELAGAPELGKPLTGELGDYRSLRAAGQRYRILYRVERNVVTVLVVAVGLRKEGDRADIYRLAQKLVRLGLLGR